VNYYPAHDQFQIDEIHEHHWTNTVIVQK